MRLDELRFFFEIPSGILSRISSGIPFENLLRFIPEIPSDIASEIAVWIAPEFSSGIFAGVVLENPERILLVILFCILSGICAGIPSKIPSMIPAVIP